MKRKELQKRLNEIGIALYEYSIMGSNPGGALSLEYSRATHAWQLYICDRNIKSLHGEYDTEDMACDHMFDLLNKYGARDES